MYLSDPHILEDWRLLWKANWTDHASRVLKKFETDVIFKVGGEWVVSIVCLPSASSLDSGTVSLFVFYVRFDK